MARTPPSISTLADTKQSLKKRPDRLKPQGHISMSIQLQPIPWILALQWRIN